MPMTRRNPRGDPRLELLHAILGMRLPVVPGHCGGSDRGGRRSFRQRSREASRAPRVHVVAATVFAVLGAAVLSSAPRRWSSGSQFVSRSRRGRPAGRFQRNVDYGSTTVPGGQMLWAVRPLVGIAVTPACGFTQSFDGHDAHRAWLPAYPSCGAGTRAHPGVGRGLSGTAS